MTFRLDWSNWDLWDKLWKEWVRTYKGEKNINLEHIQFVDLYNFFRRQIEALGVDPHTVDVKAFIDPRLTYDENKKILAEILAVPPRPEEYGAMYDEYKHQLEEQVKEKYPDVWAEWEKRIRQLEKETESLPKVERDRAKFKKLAENLRYELDETIRKHEEEKAALEKKVAPVKLRVLRSFKEGIIEYTVGSVVETRDIDWALGLIEKELAERVTVEVPVEVKPPAPPTAPPEEIFKPPKKKVEWTREFETRLRDIFETTLRVGLPEEKLPGLSPTRFWSEFRLELDAIKTLGTEQEMIRAVENLAKSIIRRESRPPPPAPPLPPGWRETENGYLTPEGEFIPKEEFPRVITEVPLPLPEGWKKVPGGFFDPWGNFIPEGWYVEAVRRWEMKPPDKGLWAWIYQKYGLKPGEFIRQSKEEQEHVIAEYRKLALPPGFRSISFADWLKQEKHMTVDEYAKLSNEEKSEIFDDYIHW